MPSLLKQLQNGRFAEKGSKKKEPNCEATGGNHRSKVNGKATSSSSEARDTAHREFLAATAKTWGRFYSNYRTLPSLEAAFSSFKDMYPRYCETLAIESLRVQEYVHLVETGRVCLDYCGFGLFSYMQQFDDWESASFALSSLSVNLCAHALFGVAKQGTTECDIRKRVMDYLNIQDSEYSMVFTASRGASFKLLADAYPFDSGTRLVTMYDYESESLDWLVQHAKLKGAKVSYVSFKWPSLRIVSTKLRKSLIAKGRRRKRGSARGLFVFPVQSRVSGAKYSYQWMSLAQQNKWHVLLDASAVGPKEMDSLGLSMFKPDFIVASFYKVFGADPSGFGCLFIKNTAMQTVQSDSGDAAPGIVRIIPFPTVGSSSESPVESIDVTKEPVEDSGEGDEGDSADFEFPKSSQLIQGIPSFSGPMLGFDKFSSPDVGVSESKNGKEEEEDDDDDSSVCESTGGVSRSPVFSEEGTENLFHLDAVTSPGGSASRASLSDDQLSEPFSGPIHNPAFKGQLKSNGPQGLQNPLYEDDGFCNIGKEAKETMKPETFANYKYGPMLDSITRLPKENSLLLLNEDTERKTSDYCPLPEISNNHADSGKRETSNDTNSDAISSSAMSDYKQQHLQDHPGEIEMIEDCAHGIECQKTTEENCSWNPKESAIRRETEGDFRLLGRRSDSSHILGHVLLPLQCSEDLQTPASQDRYFKPEGLSVDSYHSSGGSSDLENNKHVQNNKECDEHDSLNDSDPEVVCKSLDHADMLGLNKSTLRHRCLINWLVSSLLQLQHSEDNNTKSLVCIYGPQIKYDRGASVAFNLYDCHGKRIHPELVMLLADKNNVSLSIGFLKNLQVSENDPELQFFEERKKIASKQSNKGTMARRIQVVTVALSILSSFEDVYKLWLFVAHFLDSDFATRELRGS